MTTADVPLSVMVFVPVPDKLQGVAPPKFNAALASVSVDVPFALFVVVTVPLQVTVPPVIARVLLLMREFEP